MEKSVISKRAKASGVMATYFPTIDEKDEMHQAMMEIRPQLIASAYQTRKNILLTHWEYTCHFVAQRFCYPKRDAAELFSMDLTEQAQNLSILMVSAMLAVRWLEANAGTIEQEIAVPTPEQLGKVSLSRELDLQCATLTADS